jgi:hypothetical protein
VSHYTIRTEDSFLPCEASALFQQVISGFLPMKWISLAIGPKGKYWCEIECTSSRGSVKLEISPKLHNHLRRFFGDMIDKEFLG